MTGVQRVGLVPNGVCWMCGLPAVAGEKLPGRRHRVRLLCHRHDELIFGTPEVHTRMGPRRDPATNPTDTDH